MERGSVQHGARLDDDLAAGVDEILHGGSGVDRDDQAPELPGTEELIADGVELGVGPIDERREPVGSVSAEEARQRSELARFLLPAVFPADAMTILDAARAQDAPDDVLVLLSALAPGTTFTTVGEVWREVGGAAEDRSQLETAPAPGARRAVGVGPSTTGAGAPPPGVAPAEPAEGRPDVVSEAVRWAQLAIGLSLVPLRIGRALARELLDRLRPRR